VRYAAIFFARYDARKLTEANEKLWEELRDRFWKTHTARA